MQTIRVTKIIAAPREDVFDAYTDHEAMKRVPGVLSARLRQQGETEKNGRGAVREINCGVVWFREEITDFDRPRVMEYRIRAARPPVKHRYGRVEFLEKPEGTQIVWTTEFGVPWPAVGALVEPGLKIVFAAAFRVVLRSVQQRVMAGRPR